MSPSLVLLAGVAATWFMVGLIWFIQLVHYAQFDGVGQDCFRAYHRRHTTVTTFVVGPPMLIEAATAGLLLLDRPAGVPVWMLWVGAILVLSLWVSTAALQVPCHNRLAGGFDEAIARRLCRSNWFRTFGWTARGVLMLVIAGHAMR